LVATAAGAPMHWCPSVGGHGSRSAHAFGRGMAADGAPPATEVAATHLPFTNSVGAPSLLDKR
jgi:hypothetical protein